MLIVLSAMECDVVPNGHLSNSTICFGKIENRITEQRKTIKNNSLAEFVLNSLHPDPRVWPQAGSQILFTCNRRKRGRQAKMGGAIDYTQMRLTTPLGVIAASTKKQTERTGHHYFACVYEPELLKINDPLNDHLP